MQISWLLKKPNDLDLHCLKKNGAYPEVRTRVKRRNGKDLVCVDVSWSHQLSDNDTNIGEPTKKELKKLDSYG